MRSEKIRKILSETSEETKESVRQYANKRIMEGNEIEKAAAHRAPDFTEAARDHAIATFRYVKKEDEDEVIISLGRLRNHCKHDFLIGAVHGSLSNIRTIKNLETELTRTSKELDDMTTKYNELSKKYADLHKFAYGIALRATRPKDDYLNEEI